MVDAHPRGRGALTDFQEERASPLGFVNWYYQLFHSEKVVNIFFKNIQKSMLTRGDALQYG
jgi:hypothetical protein